MFQLGMVVKTQTVQFGVIDTSLVIPKGTTGIIYDMAFGGGVDEIFYIVDFELGRLLSIRAIARGHELTENDPAPH